MVTLLLIQKVTTFCRKYGRAKEEITAIFLKIQQLKAFGSHPCCSDDA
jgi:hypothetical protein